MAKNIKKRENDLWDAADSLREGSRLSSQEYCMPVLGLIYLRYAYTRFKFVEKEIQKTLPCRNGVYPPIEAKDFTAKRAIFLPETAQYDYLLRQSADGTLSKAVDDAMTEIEKQSKQLTDITDKNLKIRKIREAVNILVTPPEDKKKKFSLLCSQFFRLYKYLLPSEISNQLRKDKGGIEVIYKRMNKKHTPADLTNVLIEMQKVVNDYIKLDDNFTTPTESVKIDISEINFEVLQKEFEKVKQKAIVIHDVTEILDTSIEALCCEVPSSTQFFEHYKEMIKNYNKAQDKAEIRKVFEELQKTAKTLTEEQNRYIKLGFKDRKELAVYELLFNEDLSKSDIKKIKELAVKLLAIVKERLAEMHNPFEKPETSSAIEILIRNTLWQEIPESCFKDVNIYSKRIFDYIQNQFSAA